LKNKKQQKKKKKNKKKKKKKPLGWKKYNFFLFQKYICLKNMLTFWHPTITQKMEEQAIKLTIKSYLNSGNKKWQNITRTLKHVNLLCERLQ